MKKNCIDLKDNNYLSVKATLNGCVFRRDYKISRLLVEVWDRDPRLSSIGHRHLVLISVILVMTVVLKWLSPQFTISVLFGGEKHYQLSDCTKTSFYYNVTAGIQTSGLPNRMNHGYGSLTLLPTSP